MVWWREEGNVRELREEGDGVGESGEEGDVREWRVMV